MNKKIWLGLAVVVLAAVAVSLIALPRGSEWTTDSPEALAEFHPRLVPVIRADLEQVFAYLGGAGQVDHQPR